MLSFARRSVGRKAHTHQMTQASIQRTARDGAGKNKIAPSLTDLSKTSPESVPSSLILPWLRLQGRWCGHSISEGRCERWQQVALYSHRRNVRRCHFSSRTPISDPSLGSRVGSRHEATVVVPSREVLRLRPASAEAGGAGHGEVSRAACARGGSVCSQASPPVRASGAPAQAFVYRAI